MMSPELNNFFDTFGTASPGITLAASNTFEQNVVALVEHYDSIIEPGHGLFFDLSATPEYEKPVLDYLVKGFGWILETASFIRKPA